MNEDFVSFELAKKLKEKGFREKCLCRYKNYSKTLHINEVEPKIARKIDYSEFFKCYNSYVDSDIDAPTISQVLNWLRKEKKILVVAAPAFSYREARYFWQCGIYKISLLPNVIPFHKFIDNQESRESAILAGIEYVIDNFLI